MMGEAMGSTPFFAGMAMQDFSDHKSRTQYRERVSQILELEKSLIGPFKNLQEPTQIERETTENRISQLKRANELDLENLEGRISEQISTRFYNKYRELTDQQERYRTEASVILDNNNLSESIKQEQLKDLKEKFDKNQRAREMVKNPESDSRKVFNTMVGDLVDKKANQIVQQQEEKGQAEAYQQQVGAHAKDFMKRNGLTVDEFLT